MKLLRYDVYRDGGSLGLFTDEGEYVVNKTLALYGQHSKNFFGRITKGYDNDEKPKPSISLDQVAQIVAILEAQGDSWLRGYVDLIRGFYGARIAPRNDKAWIKEELIRS